MISKIYLVYVIRKSTNSKFIKGIFDYEEDALKEVDYLSKEEDYEVFMKEIVKNISCSIWI